MEKVLIQFTVSLVIEICMLVLIRQRKTLDYNNLATSGRVNLWLNIRCRTRRLAEIQESLLGVGLAFRKWRTTQMPLVPQKLSDEPTGLGAHCFFGKRVLPAGLALNGATQGCTGSVEEPKGCWWCVDHCWVPLSPSHSLSNKSKIEAERGNCVFWIQRSKN